MHKQQQTGGQYNSSLAQHTKLAWLLPDSISNSDGLIDDAAKLFNAGDPQKNI